MAEVSERYVRAQSEVDPLWALFVGVDGPARMTDFSPEGEQVRADLARSTLLELAGADEVDRADRLGKIFLTEHLEGELAIHQAHESERLVSAIRGVQMLVRMTFDLLPHENDSQWETVATLMEQVPETIAGYQAQLNQGIANGRVSSVRMAESVAEQCVGWAHGWFTGFASGYGDGPLAARLADAASRAQNSYGELGGWLRTEYVPRAVPEDGVGEERYQAWARANLGTVLDVGDAYAWGWQELGRIEAAKAVEAGRVKPGASCAEASEYLNNHRSRGIESADAWRAWLQNLTDSTISSLDGVHFDIDERLRTCRVGIPPEGTSAAPYYTAPGKGFERPGMIWFPKDGRTWFTTWELPTTVYHEAVPGHHLQNGAIRLLHLTRAQQTGFNPAHGEGWALYAERFMDEIGAFDRPDYRLGFLSMQAMRAARVVVDIGLHTGRTIPQGWPGAGEKWSYGRAVEYIAAASGQRLTMCESEVDRYLSAPAQATCYKLGERSWLAGRELARSRAGAGFDLKRWHSEALALGPLGLDDLERELAALASQ